MYQSILQMLMNGLCCKCLIAKFIQYYFNFIASLTIIERGNRNILPQVADKPYHIRLYQKPSSQVQIEEITMLAVIDTDCISFLANTNHGHDNLVTICLYAFLSIKIPIHERISNYTQCRLITLINVTHFKNKLLILARTQITLVYFPCYACHYLRSVPRL